MGNQDLYYNISSFENLILAWQKARKGKTSKDYVINFEKELFYNLMALHYELEYKSYLPKPLKSFIVRDPKTRKIHKSDFRDRIVHHAIINYIAPHFEKSFINDSCANRIGKGTSYALKRFQKFARKITKNFTKNAYCFKADIKKYFENINHDILISLIKKRINCMDTIFLIQKIVANFENKRERVLTDWFGKKGMPIGNLTSQFFANIYLNELDYFVKHILRAKYYIRYVDDFVILFEFKEQLKEWKNNIDKFLKDKLKLELHHQKSKVYSMSNGIDFVGFRNFYHFRLPRKRNIRKMENKITQYSNDKMSHKSLMESYQGWQAYAKLGNTLKQRRKILKRIYKIRKSKPLEDIDKYLR